ncbi:alkaline shock response membrane anchor protein AmaP [Sphaerisporangium aureirubrum]|uniref:Alkaline shock response membrane anchor protein AmaP n=1 Tax=Sphaerisporangium aureirubrum TaxID=1544736 RepID=A0ABW1NFE8_9ACTN
MNDRTARANRVGLTLVGLLLTLAGAAALTRALGLYGPPGPLVPADVRRLADTQVWLWPVLGLVALVVALLALRWLFVQARPGGVTYLDLEPDTGHGTTRLGARAAAGAIEEELDHGPYGERVHAGFRGAPTDPGLALNISLPGDADPAAAGRRAQQGVARLRHALESDRLPAVIRIRAAHGRAAHPIPH